MPFYIKDMLFKKGILRIAMDEEPICIVCKGKGKIKKEDLKCPTYYGL